MTTISTALSRFFQGNHDVFGFIDRKTGGVDQFNQGLVGAAQADNMRAARAGSFISSPGGVSARAFAFNKFYNYPGIPDGIFNQARLLLRLAVLQE